MDDKQGQRSGSSAISTPPAVNEYLREIGKDPTTFLNFFQQVCAQARIAGVTEQTLHDRLPEWYQGGEGGNTGGQTKR